MTRDVIMNTKLDVKDGHIGSNSKLPTNAITSTTPDRLLALLPTKTLVFRRLLPLNVADYSYSNGSDMDLLETRNLQLYSG